MSSYTAFYANLKTTKGTPVRKLLENFVKDQIRGKLLFGKQRQEQSDLVQDLMLRMAQLYEQTFGTSGEQATTLDGVENCVCKNLHQELFSSLAPESEQEYNEKVC